MGFNPLPAPPTCTMCLNERVPTDYRTALEDLIRMCQRSNNPLLKKMFAISDPGQLSREHDHFLHRVKWHSFDSFEF